MKVNPLYELTCEAIDEFLRNDPTLLEALRKDSGRKTKTIKATYMCHRFKTLMQEQGVDVEGPYELSTIARITQVVIRNGRCALRLTIPVWDANGPFLHSIVTLPVAFDLNDSLQHPKTSNLNERCSSGYAVGEFVRMDYTELDNFATPTTEFRINPPMPMGCGQQDQIFQATEINPFVFCNPTHLDSYIGAPVFKSEGLKLAGAYQPELRNDVTLYVIAVLAKLFRCLDLEDQALLRAVLLAPDHLDQWVSAPASTRYHHSHKHGLLQHTTEVCLWALYMVAVSDSANKVDLSLLLMNCILHDIGKLDEYEQVGTQSHVLTQGGILIGHPTSGVVKVSQAASAVGFSNRTRLFEIIHGISAVGKDCEQSGNRSRMTLEAQIMHKADVASASGREVTQRTPSTAIKQTPSALTRHLGV